MTAKFLDLFGEILIENVRDEAIEQWDMIIKGKIKATLPHNNSEVDRKVFRGNY